jgi:hypothetical protein
MYYDVQNVDQLNNVFSSIALNLAPTSTTNVAAHRACGMSWLPGR